MNDEETRLWDQLGASGRSTFLFLNDDGTFSRSGYGEVDGSVLEDRIQDLITT